MGSISVANVPAANIAAMAISSLICLGLPVALAVWLHKKKGAAVVPFFVGCAVFLLFAMVLEQGLHALAAGPQHVQCRQVRLRGRQAQAGVHDLRVLGHHRQGLAAERLGLVAHLRQALAVLRFQGDQIGQGGFQGDQRVVDGGQLGGGQGQGDSIECHCGVTSLFRG